jgi:hypothetical protein
MDLRLTHLPLDDDEESCRQLSPPNSIILQPFERLTSLSNELESTIELLSLLRAQHGARSTIFVGQFNQKGGGSEKNATTPYPDAVRWSPLRPLPFLSRY